MFTLTRVIGVVNAGALQPSQLQVIGDWACPGGANSNIAVEMRVLAPRGAPGTTFAATTNNGPNGPAGSVTFTIPAWSGAICGEKFACEVRGMCNGAWTAWEGVDGTIDCLGCPRIQMSPPTYGACTGTPASQSVTLSAVVMLPPGGSSTFTWDFGDGNISPAVTLTNTSGNPNTPLNVSITHTYADQVNPYRACLKPGNQECPPACVDIRTTCTPSSCPTITGSVSYGPCNSNLTRPTTFQLTINPPIPANSPFQISWAYGAANASGATTYIQNVNTSAGPVSAVQHTTDLIHRAQGYSVTATPVVVVNGQVCPLQSVSINASPGSCIPCPTPGQPVILTITIPSDGRWCAPMNAPLAATFAAQVNWQSPVPQSPPVPVRFDWTVTGPSQPAGAQTWTQQAGATVSTSAGWSSLNATGLGPVDLTRPGTYTVSVAAVFSPSSGLPTDNSGAVACDLVGGGSFILQNCTPVRDCPEVVGLSPSAVGCIDQAAGTAATVTFQASVNDPAGTAQSYSWDFGDPQSSGNQITTATPAASHSYARAGSYTVTCRVTSSDPNCSNRNSTFGTSVSISDCVTTPPPRTTLQSCAALLWTSLIFMLVGALLLIAGCLVNSYVPPPAGPIIGLVLAIIGAALFLIGIILFILWWAICRFFTACEVILAAWTFMGVMIAVFGVITAILAIITIFDITKLPCAIGAAVTWGYWGLLYWIMSEIAVAVGCLIKNPGGSSPPVSSSSGGLYGDPTRSINRRDMYAGGLRRQAGIVQVAFPGISPSTAIGLGDLITKATSAIGIRPCQACHERAVKLNQIAQFGGIRK